MTPSAISHQIKLLEDFLGLELFRRYKRKVELTSAGKDYLKAVQKALKEIDRATQKLIATHTSGELNLAVAPAFLSRWLLPRISRFYDENPDLEIHIQASTGLIDFDRSDVDMAVYFGKGDWQDIEMHFLRESELIPVCTPDLMERKPINSPQDLDQHTLLHVDKRSEEWKQWFDIAGAEYHGSKIGMYLSSGLLTANAAAKGLGVALSDLSLISEEINAGQLVVPLQIPLPVGKSFYLVYQKNRPLSYAMQAFKEWIMQEMSQDVLIREASSVGTE